MTYSNHFQSPSNRDKTNRVHAWALRSTLAALAMMSISMTGCYGVGSNINLGFLEFPLPVSPYYQHKQEEKFWKQERV